MSAKLLHTLLLLFVLIPCTDAAALPPSVLAALREAHIPLASVGVEVLESHAHTSLISLNSSKPMNPASTMKLLTTYAGLELLGPSYTWKTEAWLDGKLEGGVLQGNLILKGYGDPKFTLEQFWLWLKELRGRGLQEIHGNIILDRSAFQLEPYDPAAFDHDPVRAYNVGPDALLLNYNAVQLHFIPHATNVDIFFEPELAGITLDNSLSLVEQGNCADWNDQIFPQILSTTLLLKGIFPRSCGERVEYVNLLPHSHYVNGVFRALWQELGGKLSGEVVDGVAPENATLLATHFSQPLSELIRDINKFSNNVMARQLFLGLSLSPTAPATIARSEEAVHNWLSQKQLNLPGLVLENGAGLSRSERISPHSMALLLQAAQTSPLQPEFESSLPLLGIDGTLKKRLQKSEVTQHAHLKTGSLEGVKAIAGYVQSKRGKKWIVVLYINHPNASAGQHAQDALIEWVHRH